MDLKQYLLENADGHRELIRQYLVELVDSDMSELFELGDTGSERFSATTEFCTATAYALGEIVGARHANKMGPGDALVLIELCGASLMAGLSSKLMELDGVDVGETGSPANILAAVGWIGLNKLIHTRMHDAVKGGKPGSGKASKRSPS